MRLTVRAAIAWLALGVLVAHVEADDTVEHRDMPQQTTLPVSTPLEDDANLHDVQFVGTQTGWAVGDRGVIWHTTDGGANWSLQPCPVDCSLRSVCFLTDRVGWVAGGGITEYSGIGYGVLLFTNDGGQTWNPVPTDSLPQLMFVKFFGLQHGVLIAEASPACPSGVLRTEDGGKTWVPLEGSNSPGWRTADFVSMDAGVVGGLRGQLSVVADVRTSRTQVDLSGLRGIHSIRLHHRNGWLVGDGAMAMRTSNGGVSWETAPTPLPEGLREFADFRAVGVHGENVWIAGRPGSVVWHSPDNGSTWQKQRTGQTAPINAIRFSNTDVGCAVGDLGQILVTPDGGQTWRAARGANRRAALLAVAPRPNRISFHMLAKLSGELGYRSAVIMPARRDTGPDGHTAIDDDLRLHSAVVAAHGSAGEFDWQFPIAVPGMQYDSDRLLDDWKRRTENRLGQVFLGHLVGQLRTWRPNIVVIDQPSDDDATAQVLDDAIRRAVVQAADPTHFIEHYELAGLRPWRVERVYQRLPSGSTSRIEIQPYRYLARLGTTAHVVAAPAYGRMGTRPPKLAESETYRLIVDADSPADESPLDRNFFVDIPLAPGSEARRELLPYDPAEEQKRREIAARQHRFRAYAERFLDQPRHAGQVLAQLDELSEGMTSGQAALQLSELADDYRRHANWKLAEATLVELVHRHPQQPISLDAMRWLLQFWSSAEMSWHRSRHMQMQQLTSVVDKEKVIERVKRAIQLAQTDPSQREFDEELMGPDPLQYETKISQVQIDRGATLRESTVHNWRNQALRMASLIRKTSPNLYRTPEVQFPLAAVLRERGVYHQLVGISPQTADADRNEGQQVSQAAMAMLDPMGLAPKQTTSCRFAVKPPYLDAVFSDECWQDAKEIVLSSSSDAAASPGSHALVMLAYDAKHLYLAASFPYAQGAATEPPLQGGRAHDADLRRFDRLSLFVDIDRDYTTYYSMHVDQRGQTAERCWEDATWDPDWYVAADADGTHWRIEVAIPFEELSPRPPRKTDMWGLSLVRTIPAIGVESWTHPATTHPQPDSFGLLKFD